MQSENTMEMKQPFTSNGWTTSKCGSSPLRSLLSWYTLAISSFLTLRLLLLLDYSLRLWQFGELSTLPCGADTLMKSTRPGMIMLSRKISRTCVKSFTVIRGLMRLPISLSFISRSDNVFHFTLRVSWFAYHACLEQWWWLLHSWIWPESSGLQNTRTSTFRFCRVLLIQVQSLIQRVIPI